MILVHAPFALTGIAYIAGEILLLGTKDAGLKIGIAPLDLRFSFVVGAIILVAALLSIPAYFTRSVRLTRVVSIITVLSVACEIGLGSYAWFLSLRPLSLYFREEGSPLVQDLLSCCWQPFVPSAFCNDMGRSISQRTCYAPLAAFGEDTLARIYTAIFAMTVAGALALLAQRVFVKECEERQRRFTSEKQVDLT
ncbi:hypothetical protein PYCC9005_005194 [Savitreella phatthalungensis]